MSTAYVKQWPNGGKTVRTITVDAAAIKVEHVGNTSVMDSGKYGVNGTFFAGSNLTGIAMQDGYGVNTAGANKYAKGEATAAIGPTVAAPCGGKVNKRGTLFHFSPLLNGQIHTAQKPVVDFSNYSGATRSNIKWAIGGYSLFLTNSYSSSDDYYNDIQAVSCANNTENASRFTPKSPNKRTAIGYRYDSTHGRQIVLAVFKSATAWEVRNFMKDMMDCSIGVMLDGGGSSQMRWKTPSGVDDKWDAGDQNRKIQTMVTVTADKWL
ncbi:phosphodiester glycosidase family protein [Paenibacillus yanchengensis]|uniref:Phosphodiester glycosidase family protein n=1 Tax=Paenibacillus yanchengensis TaxID=2035833 RepID=A0ABW4YHE6_9BACL